MGKQLSYATKVQRLTALADKHGVNLAFLPGMGGGAMASVPPGSRDVTFWAEFVAQKPWYILRAAFFHELAHLDGNHRFTPGTIDSEVNAMKAEVSTARSEQERIGILQDQLNECKSNPHKTAIRTTVRWAAKKWHTSIRTSTK